MTTSERRHLIRVAFWAIQIPAAVFVAVRKPEWERGLFAYLVILSIAALVESAATDYFHARSERELAAAVNIVTTAAADQSD